MFILFKFKDQLLLAEILFQFSR